MAKGTLWDANTLKLMKALHARLMNPKHRVRRDEELTIELIYAIAALEKEINNAKKT